jgi:hypothetical protein
MARSFFFASLLALPAFAQGVNSRSTAYETVETDQVRWVTKPAVDGDQPLYRRGTFRLDPKTELSFETPDGEELRIPYKSIVDLQFGEVARPPRPVKSTIAQQPEKPGKPRGRFTKWMPRVKAPKVPSVAKLSPTLPGTALNLLTISHKRGDGVEHTYFHLGKEYSIYLMNSLSIKSNVPVRKVGFRDPWRRPAITPASPAPAD